MSDSPQAAQPDHAEAFRRVHAADIERWAGIVRRSGASLD